MNGSASPIDGLGVEYSSHEKEHPADHGLSTTSMMLISVDASAKPQISISADCIRKSRDSPGCNRALFWPTLPEVPSSLTDAAIALEFFTRRNTLLGLLSISLVGTPIGTCTLLPLKVDILASLEEVYSLRKDRRSTRNPRERSARVHSNKESSANPCEGRSFSYFTRRSTRTR